MWDLHTFLKHRLHTSYAPATNGAHCGASNIEHASYIELMADKTKSGCGEHDSLHYLSYPKTNKQDTLALTVVNQLRRFFH